MTDRRPHLYRGLRRVRAGLSTAAAVLLTWAIVDSAFAVTPIGRLITQTQLIPAILGGSVVWLVGWVLTTLMLGRVYCSTVCPIGYLLDVGGHAGRRAGRAYRYAPAINILRYSVAAIVGACLFAGLRLVVRYTDPYSIYSQAVGNIAHAATIAAGSLAIALVAIAAIVALGWYRGRLVCNTVCPAGGLLGLLSRHPVYNVDINTDLCTHCGKCEDACKAQCIDLRDCVVDNSRCVMCMDCTAVCPNAAITVRRGHHRLSTPLMQPTMQHLKAKGDAPRHMTMRNDRT